MRAFDRYAPFVQEYIYQNHWENLRSIQVAAADAIFNTDENVLLTASTASGKTEAAFFPIITLFSEDMPSSVGCIYIGPLKALINDQFSRLNDLCAEADIPVWHWHGDVAQSHKAKLMKHPSGILQITPESLEALLLHKHAAIAKLFGDLRFVVIDEVHSLLRGDRGGQTLCLIERLSRIAGVNPRRIGLSATIGDPEGTGEFLSLGTGRKTIIPKIDAKGSKWRLSMEHFYVKDAQAAEDKQIPGALPVLEEKTDDAPANADPGIGYIFEHTRGKKCLVFVNSREECEMVTTTLRHYCELNHEPDRFLVHHGNLSASYRETAEGIMKDDSQYMTTVTTATLELGIDIGRLERAFQIDAPWTVSSFLQRMGAPAGGSFRRKCGSSSGRTSRRCGPCCQPPFHGSYCRALRWCSCIWKNAGWSRPGWTGFPSASCTIKPCPHWLPAASCPHGRWPTGCCGCITSTGSRRRTTGCCSGISSPQTTFSRRSRAV